MCDSKQNKEGADYQNNESTMFPSVCKDGSRDDE